MIPLLRSIVELMKITQSSVQENIIFLGSELNPLIRESSRQEKSVKHIKPKREKDINLPDLRKANKDKWVNRKKAISKFIDELDYNNQIQSSYDLTLLARQNKSEHKEAA